MSDNIDRSGPKLSKEEKKAAKEAKKAAKAAAKAARAEAEAAAKAAKAAKAAAEAGPREPPVIETPDDAHFGDIRLVQSQYRTERKFNDVGDVGAKHEGQNVWLRARFQNVRHKGGSAFVVLRDGLSTVQAVLFAGDGETTQAMVDYVAKIPAESVVEVRGAARLTPKPTKCTQSDVELAVDRVYVVSVADNLPFLIADAARPEDAEGATVSQPTRLDSRWVDLRVPATHATFKIQSWTCHFFREYLLERDFTEIHTPKITGGVSEGGANVFRLDYFGRDACLAQSPQLFKQQACACGGLNRVFEIGPVFRAEDSNTHRHLCEFVGLDFESVIVEDYTEVLELLGGVLVHIFDGLNAKCQREIAAIKEQYGHEPLRYHRNTLVIKYTEGVAMLRAAGATMGDHDDLSTENERLLGKLVREKYDTDLFILDKYPLSVRPFYTMPCPDDPLYSNSYDVILRGEEITSGAQRVHDVAMLRERAEACGIPADNITSYVESFTHGVPPHGGAGIGMERLVMLFLGLNNIRKSSMFPRDPSRLTP